MHAGSDYTGPDAAARNLVAELSDILSEFAGQCAIIGGMAYNFWREPRFTKDVDFTLIADRTRFAQLEQRMVEAGYQIDRIQNEDEPSGPGFVRFTQPGTQKIVEFLSAKTEFQELLIERAVKLGPEHRLRVATPEDVVVLKLIANRPQDQADAINLGLIEGLDWEYVERWSEVWDIGDRLGHLRAAVDAEQKRLADLRADDPSQTGQ